MPLPLLDTSKEVALPSRLGASGIFCPPKITAYCTPPSPSHQTKGLAAELGPRGIRVNCVAPGIVPTKFSAALVETPELVGVARTWGKCSRGPSACWRLCANREIMETAGLAGRAGCQGWWPGPGRRY